MAEGEGEVARVTLGERRGWAWKACVCVCERGPVMPPGRRAARPATYTRATALPAPPTHLERPGATKVRACVLSRNFTGGGS